MNVLNHLDPSSLLDTYILTRYVAGVIPIRAIIIVTVTLGVVVYLLRPYIQHVKHVIITAVIMYNK